MARVYKLKNIEREGSGQEWWSVTDGKRTVSVLCHKVLKKLCHVNSSKPLDLCVSKTKPKHDDYLEYSLVTEYDDWVVIGSMPSPFADIFYLKINGEWKAIDTFLTFREFLSSNLRGGYIWVEQ
jgi:hypothetical protein